VQPLNNPSRVGLPVMGPMVSAAYRMEDGQATAFGKSTAFTSCGILEIIASPTRYEAAARHTPGREFQSRL
jgi:hypothetical protein